jgi:hypothetical protein
MLEEPLPSELRAAVERLADGDPDPDVREAARRTLAARS